MPSRRQERRPRRLLPSGSQARLLTRIAGARLGLLETRSGSVETPAFMPVGTQATVKGLTPDQLRATGTQMLLANTYHLALRPGEQVVRVARGAARVHGLGRSDPHRFGWVSGVQPGRSQSVTDHGVTFRSHLDGRLLELTPETSDGRFRKPWGPMWPCAWTIARHCRPRRLRSPTRSAGRSPGHGGARRRTGARDQALFGIVQGGPHADLRAQCVDALVGPGLRRLCRRRRQRRARIANSMRQALAVTTHLLPADRPRYLMGVGRPQDILDAVATGIDLFDCVMPTRNGRNATCFTEKGYVKLRNAAHRLDPATDRGGLRVPGLPPVQPLVSPPSVPGQGDARPDLGVDP